MRPADRRNVLVVAVASVVLIGLASVPWRSGGTAPSQALAESASITASPPVAASTTTAPPLVDPLPPSSSVGPDAVPVEQDLVGDDPASAQSCVLRESSVRLGESGQDVLCLQQALTTAGLLTGPPTGQFDTATQRAVEQLQRDRELYVDGVVGRETALSLGIWPDEQANVVRTPPPLPGAVDLLGYRLSSVASAGSDAPPLPPNSGSGRRLVYERAAQRVWAVDDDGSIIRSWLVSGSKYNNELPGTHEVYSRSEMSTAWNGKAWLPKMVRWLKTDIGAIGFHALPRHVEDNSPYQTDAELGTRLSGGCQRQADLDAAFTWDFAQVGTKVVVI